MSTYPPANVPQANYPQHIRPTSRILTPAFMPAYLRARKRWGAPPLPALSFTQNPVLPSFSLNEPVGSDFQNFYPQLYNEEKTALATVLGTLNPGGVATTAYRTYQYNDVHVITTNVAQFNGATWGIVKDNASLPAFGLIVYPGTAGYIFTSAPVGANALSTVASIDQNGNFVANNYPPAAIPLPQVGGWEAPGTYTFNFEPWCQWARIYVTGGGGGGGSGYRSGSGGAGGAAGGTVIAIIPVNPAQMNPCTIVIGYGGTPNLNEGATGSAGENSSFATNAAGLTIIGYGGNPGTGCGAILGASTAGGSGSGPSGCFIITGNPGAGGSWNTYPNGDSLGGGGNGGGTYWGGGGQGGYCLQNLATGGLNGTWGGGAGGGATSSIAGNAIFNYGGYGGAGIIMVERYA